MSLKKIIKYILHHINWINRDWEDKSLIMQAPILMASDYWRVDRANFQIRSKEFRVYSQWGDDGIIQYLMRNSKIESDSIVYTSGSAGLFKAGIPIGKIIEPMEKVLVDEKKVIFFSDFSQLSFVEIASFKKVETQ